MPPKKSKPSKDKPTFQTLPQGVRQNITEYLQPTVKQQERMQLAYSIYSTANKTLQVYERNPDLSDFRNLPGFMEREREYVKRVKGWYEKDKKSFTSAPGLHETYRFFWDDNQRWPDEGPDPDIGGGDMLTT
jgi:hypothetical protein